jgi:transposase
MAQQRTLTLTAAQRRELTDHRDHHPKPYVRERCAALLKIAAGQSPHAVALTGLLKPRNPDTVYQWLDWYETEGLAGLLQHQQGGHRGQGPTEIQLVELVERLRYQPDLFVEWSPEWARPELLLARGQPRPIPVRWSLKRIRASMPWLSAYTLSGIWRLLHRIGIRLRQGRPQLFSPDPQYKAKEAQLLAILAEVGANPTDKVALFLDEVSYYHWPQAARLWARLKAAVTLAGRAAPGNSQ